MRIFITKNLPLFLAVFILTTVFFSSPAQASFWNIIKAWVTINPLEVNLSVPLEVEINKVFKVEAKVINKGKERIEKVKGEIFLPEGLILIRKDPVQKIGVIPGKKEKKISWPVKGEKEGNYIISVRVSGELNGSELTKEVSAKVVIKEKGLGVREKGIHFFNKFLEFFSEVFF